MAQLIRNYEYQTYERLRSMGLTRRQAHKLAEGMTLDYACWLTVRAKTKRE